MRRYALVGLGKVEEDETIIDARMRGRKIGNALSSICTSEKGVKLCSILLPYDAMGKELATELSDLSASFIEGLYSDNRYRTGKRVKNPAGNVKHISILLEARDATVPALSMETQEAVSAGRKIARGTFLSRDIVNSPHNIMNSHSLADTAKRLAEESDGLIQCNILEKEDCEKRGMGAYLGVARGSETGPKFIHLVYKPRNRKGLL